MAIRHLVVPLLAMLLPCAARADPGFRLESSAFAAGGEIPVRSTCSGSDSSPPLSWQGAPDGTKSFALVVVDPDAPDPAKPLRTWVHWVLYAIPPGWNSLAEGIGASDSSAAPARHGSNDWSKRSYGGPCPPIGRHRYFFRLYALDVDIAELEHPTRQTLEAAMKGHVLATAELMGTFRKD